MNGHERVNAALEGCRPDLTPVILHNFMHAAKEAGLTMRQYYSNASNIARVHIEAVERYSLDGVLIDIDTAVIASAVGVPVDFPEDQPARCHDRLLQTIEAIDDLEPVDVSKNERIQIAVEACSLVKKYFGDEIYIRGNADQAPFSLASMMRTPSEWMMDLLMDEERAHKLLKYCANACMQFIDLMSSSGVHMISQGDSPAGPDMISPEMYYKYALPYEKMMLAKANEHNLPYMLHICGNTNAILDQMQQANFDAVELDFRTDISKIYSIMSNSVVFSGNIDPTGIITFGTPEMVKNKVRELKKIYSNSSRLIINAGCAIPSNAPSENIKAIVAAAREN